MKVGNENYCEQSFNAQAAVEVESRLIVGQGVSQATSDKQERVPPLACIRAEVGGIAAALVDSGCFSPAAVQGIKQTAAAKRPARRSMRRWRRPGITGAWLTWKNNRNPKPPHPVRAWPKSCASDCARAQARLSPNCGNKPWNWSSASSRACSASGSSGFGGGRKCRWNGRAFAWSTT
jgi:hypothetical protein